MSTTINTTTSSGIPLNIEDYGNQEEEVPVEKNEPKKHWSQWFILLNSNKMLPDLQNKNEIIKIMKDALSFSFKNHLLELLKKKNGGKVTNTDVVEVNLTQVGEIGKRVRRAHVHATVAVVHTSLLQLDYGLLRQYIQEYFDEHSPDVLARSFFLSIKFFRSNEAMIKMYMRKSQ